MSPSVRSLAVAALAALPLAARPVPAAEEVARLGTTLTEIGAERAGNADGSIPPYAGGLTTPPARYVPGSGRRPDPFEGERPVLSVDRGNAAAHAARLSEGVRALLERYPDFRVDVYPTHRTVAFPRFVLENTARGAPLARAPNDGLSLEGVRAAFPFPIPKTGREAMWNHLLRFTALCDRRRIFAYHVPPTGRPVLSSSGHVLESYPYWDPRASDRGTYFRFRITYDGPPRRAGEGMILVDPVDSSEGGRRAWQYAPGQRRVRLAPSLAYDTPNPATAGAQTFDDALLFNGAMDRYDFALLGKRELYVPYNVYRAVYEATAGELLRPRFLAPELVRWELHRVWVVEATLRPGKRHVYARRVFYLDEDSWAALLSDSYDGRGRLWRVGVAFMAPSYDVPAPWPDPFLHYDLFSGAYALNGWPGAEGWLRHVPCPSEGEWSPDALAGAGVRCGRARGLARAEVGSMLGAVVLAAGLAALAPGAPAADPLDVPASPSALAATSPLVAVAVEGGVAVAVGQRGHVLRSDDGGRRWTQASVPASADLTAVHLGPGGRGLAVGHDGLVLATEDGGRTWTRRLDGRALAALLRASPDGCEASAALRIACEQGAALSLLDVWVGEDGRGLAVGAFGLVLRTEDGGRSWAPWLDRAENPRALHLHAVRAAGGEVLVAGEQGLLLRLDRARGRLVPVPAPAGGSLFGLVVRGREAVAFGLGGRTVRSADAGASWAAAASGVRDALVGGTVLPGGRIVLLSVRGALVRSDDGGRTFRPLGAAGLAPAAAVAAAGPDAVLVTGAAGVRRTELP